MTGSPQLLDPLGSLVAPAMAGGAGVLALGYCADSTVRTWDQVRVPTLWVAAVAALAAACLVLVLESRTRRAPFTRSRMLWVAGLGIAAAILSAASMWGANTTVVDDWGQTAVALLIIGMAITRPWHDLLVVGAAAILVVVLVALAQTPFLVTPMPDGIVALVVAGPIGVASASAAAYSACIAVRIQMWHANAEHTIARAAPRVREVSARIVHQRQMTLLHAELVPFFEGVLERGAVDENDRERAAAIAARLRGGLLSQVQSTWLDEVRHAAALHRDSVDDPGGVAAEMPQALRAILSALIAAAAAEPGLHRDGGLIALRRAGPGWKARVVLHVDNTSVRFRRELRSYLAVLRIATDAASLTKSGDSYTLKFSYDRA